MHGARARNCTDVEVTSTQVCRILGKGLGHMCELLSTYSQVCVRDRRLNSNMSGAHLQRLHVLILV